MCLLSKIEYVSNNLDIQSKYCSCNNNSPIRATTHKSILPTKVCHFARQFAIVCRQILGKHSATQGSEQKALLNS